METSESKPTDDVSKAGLDDVKTKDSERFLGLGRQVPLYGPFGIRYIGGVNAHQAFVGNVGSRKR
jgi:hypothetical protein